MIIRILLLAGLTAIGWLVFLRRNKMPFHIVTLFGLLGLGAIAIIMPESSQAVAEFVGVGRGADLIMYISLVAVLFVLVHYYGKFVELQRNVTQLTRELAIMRTEAEQRSMPAPAPTTITPPAAPARTDAPAITVAEDPS